EEETNGPPRAMEEEEDDDEGEDTVRGGRGQTKSHRPDTWRSGKGKPVRAQSRKVSYRNLDAEEDDVPDDDDDDADPTYKRNNVSSSANPRSNGVPDDEEVTSDN